MSFNDRNLRKQFSQIIGLGDLGSLHLLHLATMCGVIHDPDFVAKNAHISKGTTTWKKVVSVFHLGETVLNRMILDLAKELNVPQQVIENALCEFCRDCDI